MTTQSQASASPATVRIGDREFRMAPLSLRDYGELDRWVQVEYIRSARASLEPGMDEDERKAEMQHARREAQLVGYMTHGVKLLNSTPGIAFLLWLGIRKEQPEVPLSEVEDALQAEGSTEAGLDVFDLLNDPPEREGSAQKKRRGLIRRIASMPGRCIGRCLNALTGRRPRRSAA